MGVSYLDDDDSLSFAGHSGLCSALHNSFCGEYCVTVLTTICLQSPQPLLLVHVCRMFLEGQVLERCVHVSVVVEARAMALNELRRVVAEHRHSKRGQLVRRFDHEGLCWSQTVLRLTKIPSNNSTTYVHVG